MHWENVTGYFDKHGYFEKGGSYQGVLPEWALKRNKVIKRYETMKGGLMMAKGVGRVHEVWRSEEYKGDRRKPYRVIIESCGSQSRVKISGSGIESEAVMDVRYGEIKSWSNWKYVEGEGLVRMMDDDELQSFWDALRKAEGGREREQGRPLPPSLIRES